MTLFGWQRHWGYRMRLTLPQIELMQSDLPHTLYKRKKKGLTEKEVMRDPAYEMTMQSIERLKKRIKDNPERPKTIEEVFSDE